MSLVKLGSVTHSVDMDERFLDLQFSTSGGTLQAALPANANRTPPGYYMVFVIDAAGVPSEAKFVKIGAPTANPPPPTTTIVSPPQRRPIPTCRHRSISPLPLGRPLSEAARSN